MDELQHWSDAAPDPESGPEPTGQSGRRSAGPSASPSSRSGRRVFAGVVALMLVVGGLSLAFSGNDSTSARTSASSGGSPPGMAAKRSATIGSTALPAGSAISGGAVTDERLAGSAARSPMMSTSRSADPASLGPAALNPKIVKTGTVELQVVKGAVPGTFDRLTALAAGNGGFVAEQKTAEAAGIPNGTITLRVPAASFEAALAQVRKLGKVQSASTSGDDVTAEYTDVDARLKALTSERDQLSLVLTSAQNVGDILAVRDRINAVQTEIEQLQGRKNVLDNQVALSTINVSVREPSGDRAVPVPAGERTGFDKAWHDALHGFNSGVQALIAGSGRAVLVVLCVGVALVVARLGWRVVRRRLV